MLKCWGSFFSGKKVLITGHTGFKGSWLTQILLNLGADVVGCALKPHTNPNLFEILELEKNVSNYYVDIRRYGDVKRVFEKEQPEIVFHLAAQPLVRSSYDDPLYTYETNVIGTANILQAIKETEGVKSAVIITTDKVYENKEWVWAYREIDELGGHDPYSTSKACAELVVRSYIRAFFNNEDVFVATARAGNVIGGGDWSKDRLVPDIVRTVFGGGKQICLRNPMSIRPWQHVLEPLIGYMLLAKRLYNGERNFVGAWNFAPDDESFITVEELTKKAIDVLGVECNCVVKKDNEKHETKILKLDASKAKTYLGWRPVINIDETIKWTFEWYKRYYKGQDMIKFTNEQISMFFKKYACLIESG